VIEKEKETEKATKRVGSVAQDRWGKDDRITILIIIYYLLFIIFFLFFLSFFFSPFF